MENPELLKALIDAITGKPDAIPDGWRTAEQWAQIAGITSGQMRRKLTAAAKAGRMQRSEFLVRKGVKTISVSHFITEEEYRAIDELQAGRMSCGISREGMSMSLANKAAHKIWSGMRKERREA